MGLRAFMACRIIDGIIWVLRSKPLLARTTIGAMTGFTLTGWLPSWSIFPSAASTWSNVVPAPARALALSSSSSILGLGLGALPLLLVFVRSLVFSDAFAYAV